MVSLVIFLTDIPVAALRGGVAFLPEEELLLVRVGLFEVDAEVASGGSPVPLSSFFS